MCFVIERLLGLFKIIEEVPLADGIPDLSICRLEADGKEGDDAVLFPDGVMELSLCGSLCQWWDG